jgi:adenosylcobyric acid synthase
VNGHAWKTLSAREYYSHADQLRGCVLDAYRDLARRFDVVVIEGAGSVTELNLRQHDLVNLGLVTRIEAPWMLVADIERGGVFASIIGTAHLLTSAERALFRGFAVNKFRGDPSLFDEGVRVLERQTASPCLGVFPYDAHTQLDVEDGLALDTRHRSPAPSGARLAIVRFPRLSNATDFRLLDWADWITSPPSADYDFVILPGSKNTIADLGWLRAAGLADWVLAQRHRGACVIGVCGGYQMLGRAIRDPDGVESDAREAPGLGLLPVDTTLTRSKRTRAVTATTPGGVAFGGYEIHVGVTAAATEGDPVTPFATLEDGSPEGACRAGVLGTYLHGAFEHGGVCAEVLGVTPSSVAPKARQYERLADWFEHHARHLDRLGVG